MDLQRPHSTCITIPGTHRRVDRAPPPEVSDRGSLPSVLKDRGGRGSGSETPLSRLMDSPIASRKQTPLLRAEQERAKRRRAKNAATMRKLRAEGRAS
jgi:hypothetical protein